MAKDEIRKAYASMAILESLRYLVSMIGPEEHPRRQRAITSLDKAIASAEAAIHELEEDYRKRMFTRGYTQGADGRERR